MELNGIISSALWMFLITQTIQFQSQLPLCSCKPAGGNDTDRLSLLTFKAQITADPFNVLGSWNDSSHFCKWTGVTCGRRHKRIVKLDLKSCALAGMLSPHVRNLSFLRILNLGNNSLSQYIPEELGHLFRLRDLRFTNNSFTGGIPPSLSNCSSLQILGLGGNKLVFGLPSELGSLSYLRIIVFQINELVGGLPSSFDNLSSLEEMWGVENNLSGCIPEDIGKLERLQVLSLGENNLEGSILASIFNLSSLSIFSVSTNKLTGSLPFDIGLTLPNLSVFQVVGNHFNGPLLTTLSNASNLVFFNGAANNFTGKVPVLENLVNLEFLQIAFNNLGSGRDGVDDLEFLYSLSNSTNLMQLYMNHNQLAGVVPQILCNFSKEIRIIALGINQLRGSIPNEIGNLINLQALTFHYNLLTGTIPESIGKLKNLVELGLYENNLSGTIPYSLLNITSLSTLLLSNNKLHGKIPPSVGNLKNLISLDLDENNLSGTIPKELFGILSMLIDFSVNRNQFTGHVPVEIGKLVNLEYLGISSNKLSGEIPASLGSCRVLEDLYLQENLFEGSIPNSLSSVGGLQYANFSHNNLSGAIPKFLEDLKLIELDLSFNKLEGEVPSEGVFQNMSGISVTGNKKLCGGVLALNLSRCTTNMMDFGLLKCVIPIAGGILAAIVVASSIVAYQFYWTKNSTPAVVTSPGASFPQLSYEDLLKATDGFSLRNLIGKGSFGNVYKGVLGNNGQLVAVKGLNLLRSGANKSFVAECEALANIRHRNLVKVVTACSSIDFQGNDFKAIVYEYMGNGSLEKWLHSTADEPHQLRKLSLVQRLDIAIDVANALQYLHKECETPLVHCNLKPSNILMDMDMTSHLADFGLARFLADDPYHNRPFNSTNSVGIKGTIGYAAPEYGIGSRVSARGDIYSFGILLLEMFTGKGPSNEMFQEGITLHNFAKMGLPNDLEKVVDPVLLSLNNGHQQACISANPKKSGQKEVAKCLASILKVGVACSVESPRDRMDIDNVVSELHCLRNGLVGRNQQGRHR